MINIDIPEYDTLFQGAFQYILSTVGQIQSKGGKLYKYHSYKI